MTEEDRVVAGRLLREARETAGLTQAQLAERAGMPRPVVSAYENGHRQPSVAHLARLARAACLRVALVPAIDTARNGARFVDALSLTDAVPARRRRAPLPHPVDWRAASRSA